MGFDVVIAPSFAQVETYRKQQANARDAGSFAQTVTTFDAWIADLWELHGNGRLSDCFDRAGKYYLFLIHVIAELILDRIRNFL